MAKAPRKPPRAAVAASSSSSSSTTYLSAAAAILVVLLAMFLQSWWSPSSPDQPLLQTLAPKTHDLTLNELLACDSSALDEGTINAQPRPEVLAYITPWNRKGFVVAEQLASRGALTYAAPVFYQLRAAAATESSLELTGGHEYNGTWIEGLRRRSSTSSLIVPRVIWEVQAFISPPQVEQAVSLLVQEAQDKGYDGWTLEFPIDAQVFPHFVASLKQALASAAVVIVAIPAYQMPSRPNVPKEMQVTPALLQALAPHVDRFSVMTYDYGRTNTGVPNSPITWVKQTVDLLTKEDRGGGPTSAELKQKILLGLPWYGYANGQPILGHDLRHQLLDQPHHKNLQKFEWNEKTQEHVFVFSNEKKEQVVATFPTPAFFQRRLELVRDLGLAGVALWEIGQGLACFPLLF